MNKEHHIRSCYAEGWRDRTYPLLKVNDKDHGEIFIYKRKKDRGEYYSVSEKYVYCNGDDDLGAILYKRLR